MNLKLYKSNPLVHSHWTIKVMLICLLIAGGLTTQNAFGQASTYTYSTTSGVALETLGAPTTLFAGGFDDSSSPLTNIGFSFTLAGVNYTQFSATTNGYISLGTTASTACCGTSGGLGTYPALRPWYDDLHTGTGGSVSYQLFGTAPNQKLVVQWNVVNCCGGTPDKTFQLWLFESSNNIMFVYGAGSNPSSGSVGIMTAAANFNDVNTTSNTNSTVTAQDNNATWPGTGRAYLFTCNSVSNNYLYSTTSGISIETLGAPTTLFAGGFDDNSSPLTNIGFPFNFNGVNYTQFSATTNGYISLGVVASASCCTNSGSLGTFPALRPWYDDLHTGTGGSVSYQLFGTAPNQKLVVQWNVINCCGGTPDKIFQLWLFQSSNTIMFVYGAGSNPSSGSVGIMSSAANFNDVNTTSNTNSTVTAQDNNTTWPGTGRAYVFNPACGLPCLISVTASALPSTICVGSSSTLTATASGNNGSVSYLWSTSATTQSFSASSSGIYTVTVTDATPAGCTASATVQLTVNPVPSVTTSATPTSVPCNTPFQLTASPAPVCVTNYNLSSIAYAPLTSGTTFPGPSGDDNVTPTPVPIGFNFNFYCNTYSQLYISTNGFITFDPDFAAGCCSGQPLPNNSTAPDNLIAICWTDLNVGGPGTIDYFNLTSPNRLVIRYNNVAHCCGTTPAQVTGQIILYENGIIEIHNTSIVSNGTMTQGIENQNGTIGTPVPGRNSTGFSATNDAFRFTPLTSVSYSWAPVLNMNNPSIYNPTVSSIAANTTYTVTATNQFGCTATSSVSVTFVPVAANCSGTNNVCFGGNSGTASVTASGGNGGPYSYSWSNGGTTSGISGLTAGTYCVTVTDGVGCTATCCYTVTQPTQLTATAVATDASCPLCPDGTVSISAVSGGTPGYTFTNLTGLLPGNYCITVTDANGCTTSACATVGAAGCNLFANATQTAAVSCNGGNNGSAAAAPTGGINGGPYSYSWSTGSTNATISGLTAGNYTVVVSEPSTGCVTQQIVTITQPSAVTASCGGNPVLVPGNLTVQIQGTGFQDEVTWNLRDASNVIILSGGPYGSGTNVTAGPVPAVNGPFTLNMFAGTNFNDNDATFTVRCNGNIVATGCVRGQFAGGGCANINSGVVTNISGCNTLVSTSGNVTCFGGSDGSADVTAGGGTPGYTYLWSNGGTTSSITGLTVGNYTVTVTDANGCTATCIKSVSQPAAVTGTGTSTNVVCAESPTGSINLTPSGGTSPYTYLWSNGATVEDPGGLVAGTYTVTITDINGCTGTYSRTVSCTDNIAPVLSVGPGSGTPLFENFEAGVLPVGWSATGLWHVTAACPSGTPPNPTKWAYYGQDATCTYNNGGTNSGDLTSSTVAIPASASSAKVRFRYAYNGEGGAPPTGFDNASVKISVNGGAFVQAAPLSSTGSAGSWLAAEFNINAAIGGTIALQWNFSTQDGIANDFLGLQIDSVAITYVNLQQCPNNIVTVNDPGVCGTAVSWTPPTATDNCSVTLTSNKNPGDFFPVGTTVVTYTATDGCGNSTSCSFNVTVNQVGPPILTLTETHINADCQGAASGSIDLSVAGGAIPYTYSWSNGATTEDLTGIVVGVYTVTVTEANGCSSTLSVSVSDFPALVASETHIDVLCNGDLSGSIDITATDGKPGYDYLWDDSSTNEDRTGLGAGTYTVTISDQCGSSQILTISITEPTAFVSAPVENDVTCFSACDGNIATNASGGVSPYTYAWSNGATTSNISGLCPGNYTVLITDANGCIINSTYSITEPPQLFITETHINVTCYLGSDGSIDVTLIGGTPPFNYQWSNGATTEDVSGLNANTYFLTVKEGTGCESHLSVTVTSPPKIIIPAVLVNPSSLNVNGGSITTNVSGGVPGYSYAWSNGATTSANTGLSAGTYTVTVTDASGCTMIAIFTLKLECKLGATNTIVQNASCYKNNAIVTVAGTGGTGYTYQWQTVPVQTTATGTGLNFGTNNYVLITDIASGCSFMDTVVKPHNTSIGLVLTSPTYAGGKNIRCNGGSDGSINVAVSGDPGPFTYLWNNGATSSSLINVPAGTYIVTVTTGSPGCTATGIIALTQPSVLNASTTKVNPSCGGNNGTATASASGGVGPYSYSWNTVPVQTTITATGLSAGVYTVTVSDANGCTKTALATLTSSGGLTVTGVVTNAKCFGTSTGSIDITPSGGNPGYTYLWSNGSTTQDQLNKLAAGTYTVTVTDSRGCTGQFSATISQPSLLIATAVSTNITCNGAQNGTATVTPGGGTPGYTYSWNTVPTKTTASVTGLKPGTWTCLVTDSKGCVKAVSVTITQPTLINIGVSKTNVTTFGGSNGTATANVSGGVASYGYSWNSVPVQTTQTATGLIAGTYTVTVTDANGCTKTKSVTITQPNARILGTADTGNDIQSFLYPNPSSGLITITFSDVIQSKVSIEIYNLTGERVYTEIVKVESNSKSFNIDLSQLAKGIYTVKYQSGDHDWIDKLVIQ